MKRMINVFWILLLAWSPAYGQESAPDPASAEGTPSGEIAVDEAAVPEREPFVVICPIEGEIDEAMAVVVKRAAESAKDAEALLFVINTPGGRVDSAIDITTAIMAVDCPTIAFIEGMGAISAGALISFSCDYIYMAGGSNIGASTPIMPGVETTEAMDEKSSSFVRGKYRALGEANGHEPLLGAAMVDRNIEVLAYRNDDGTYTFIRGDQRRNESTASNDLLETILDAVSEETGGNEELRDLLRRAIGADNAEEAPLEPQSDEVAALLNEHTIVVSRYGDLLTMTSGEAVEFGLAEAMTEDMDDTLREFNLGSVNRLTITPTWEEALFGFLTSPTIAGLLLMAGLGGIYMEVRTPGFGAPGIIGATCLALFFGSHMVLGMASWIDIALIVCGFALIAVEFFLLPGFGLAGILGFACLVAGSYLALVKAPIPEFTWQFLEMQDALYSLTVATISLILFIVITGLLLPYTPMGRGLILQESQETSDGYVVQSTTEAQVSIGLLGRATSPLRPAGKGRFGNKTMDVVTRGEFIPAGTPISIIESSGNRYVVTEVKTEESA